MRRSHYETLRVAEEANTADIKRAYRKLARELHPDVNPAGDASLRMSEVNEAYRVLTNPEARAAYDAERRTGVPGAPRPPDGTMPVYVRHRFTVVDLPSPAYSLAFSPSGRELAAGCFDNAVRFVSAKTGRPLGETKLEGDAVLSLKWVSGATLVAAGAGEKSVSVWRIIRRKVAAAVNKRAEWASHAAISPDGKRVYLGSVHRTVVAIDSAAGKTLFQRRRHEDAVSALAVSSDGRLLASGANDHRVILWETGTGLEMAVIGPLRAAVSQIAYSQDASLIAVSLIDNGIRVFEVGSGVPRATLWGHDKAIEGLAFHPSGLVLASASRDGSVILWNPVTGKKLERLGGHEGPVKAVAFSRDGGTLAASGLDRDVPVWGIEV